MRRVLTRLLAVLFSISICSAVWAGPFSISPVRIQMSPKDKAVAVTITNEGDDALVMQADVYTWSQKPDGEDDLKLTEDIFLSPPIIKLAGKARQVVRLARLSSAQPTDQLTYRLIVREIPEAKPNSGNLQLQIAIAFSLPVFITPPKATAKLDCSVERKAADMLVASCENTGNAYAQIIDLTVADNSGKTLGSRDQGGYILPAIKRNFEIKSTGASYGGGKAILSVRLDDGKAKSFEINLNN